MSSNYNNPLDRFRSYSYHYVLTASGTTESFRQLSNGLLSAIESKKLGDEFKINDQTAYLVVDTRRFSQYSITSLEMEHAFGTGDKNNPTVPMAQTSMKLIDTTGLSFFGFMMDLMRNKLQTSIASTFFLLSIIFVGHTDEDTTETISTCHIPLIMCEFGFNFTSKGSEFDIVFVEMDGAPQRSPSLKMIDFLNDVTTISTKRNGSNTVGEFVDDLEEQLNIKSLLFYQKYKNTALKNNVKKPGKLVQYMITVPDDSKHNWRKMKITNAPKSKTSEPLIVRGSTGIPKTSGNVSSKAEPIYSTLSFSSTATITDAIKTILESSEEFTKLGSQEKVSAGTAIAFKTVTGITADDTTYTIHFDVFPYYVPKVTNETKKSSDTNTKINAGTTTKTENPNAAKNSMSYQYIFTGKNSHILDLKIAYTPESIIGLDMDVDIGPARFNKNASAGQTIEGVKSVSSGAKTTTEYSAVLRGNDPIFPAMKTIDQLNNGTSIKNEHLGMDAARDSLKAKQEFSKTYASLHFLSSMQLDMTIRGNPNIIRKFADRQERGGIPPHNKIISSTDLASIEAGKDAKATFEKDIKGKISSAKQFYVDTFIKPRITAIDNKQNGNNDSLLNGVDVSTMPVLASIDIRAPDVNWTGEFNDQNNMFSNKFFYQGRYLVLIVKTSFSQGDFEHNLSLIPYDVDGSYSISADSK